MGSVPGHKDPCKRVAGTHPVFLPKNLSTEEPGGPSSKGESQTS